MENKNETGDDIEEELDEDFSEDEPDNEDTDWKAEAIKFKGIAKRKATQLKKLKEAQKEEPKPQDKKDESNDKSDIDNPTDEPDYARLSFLEQRGVVHPDDQQLVQDEAKRLKLPLTDVLAMEYIKAKLKTASDTRKAEAGMPKGRGTAGSKTQADVDYWLAKGETPKDDLELAEKVINARMNKETQKNKFSEELYTE